MSPVPVINPKWHTDILSQDGLKKMQKIFAYIKAEAALNNEGRGGRDLVFKRSQTFDDARFFQQMCRISIPWH